MGKMELNPNVESWSSEEFCIPYVLMEKVNGKFVPVRHNYYPDFGVKLKTGEKYIIEIKPINQSPKTINEIKRNPVMTKNAAKWKAALNWCKQNGYIFKVVNEENLKTRIF